MESHSRTFVHGGSRITLSWVTLDPAAALPGAQDNQVRACLIRTRSDAQRSNLRFRADVRCGEAGASFQMQERFRVIRCKCSSLGGSGRARAPSPKPSMTRVIR